MPHTHCGFALNECTSPFVISLEVTAEPSHTAVGEFAMPHPMCRIVVSGLTAAVIHAAVAAWAEAPSIVPGMPPEVTSMRDCVLDKARYQAMVEDWQDYLRENPRSAVAEVQLGRALRYAGAPAEEVIRHFSRALELDPRCPESLDAAAATYLGEWKPMADGAAGCYELGQRAVALAPEWADPHFTLWPLAMVLGRSEEADGHLAALLRKGGIPAPVVDYCYNMLVGAEQNAIIFTNGDNDTYGCRALQVAHGLRPDVQILNLSLISQPEIEAEIFRRFGTAPPLTAPERAAMRKAFIENFVRDREHYFTKVLRAIAGKAARGEWPSPVYVSLTVPDAMALCAQTLRMEGILWRVVTNPSAPSPGPKDRDAGTDVTRTSEMFEDYYRLDSASDHSFNWQRNNAVRALAENYISTLFRLAVAAGQSGDQARMRSAFRRGVALATFHGNIEQRDAMLAYWSRLDPNHADARGQAPASR